MKYLCMVVISTRPGGFICTPTLLAVYSFPFQSLHLSAWDTQVVQKRHWFELCLKGHTDSFTEAHEHEDVNVGAFI